MADLSEFYPQSQQVPQNVNGTQPASPRTSAPAGMTAGAGAPALWVLVLAGLSPALLHMD